MNSPWGIEFNLIKETCLTREAILWKISWINIKMMLADAPKYKPGKNEPQGDPLETEDDFKDFLKL